METSIRVVRQGIRRQAWAHPGWYVYGYISCRSRVAPGSHNVGSGGRGHADVLTGDLHQLVPWCESERFEYEVLGRSPFELLMQLPGLKTSLVQLTIQYRMHPEISRRPCMQFDHGIIVEDKSTSCNWPLLEGLLKVVGYSTMMATGHFLVLGIPDGVDEIRNWSYQHCLEAKDAGCLSRIWERMALSS